MQLDFAAPPPTSTSQPKGMASAFSVLLHGLVLVAALCGFWPKTAVPVIPPAMVVEVVLDRPPPVLPVVQDVPAPPPTAAAPLSRPHPHPHPAKASLPQTISPTTTAAAVPLAPPSVPAPSSPEPAAAVPAAAKAAVDLHRYLPGIQQRVQARVVYPRLSLRRGEQGVVKVNAELLADGSLAEVSAADQEISPRLREAALQAVKDAAPFPQMEDNVKVIIPVVFQIR